MPSGVRLHNSMENELNQAPQPPAGEAQAPVNATSPTGNPNQSGGGGRRRRRRRKKGGSGGGTQTANDNGGGQQAQPQGQGQRPFRGDRQPNFDRHQGQGGGGKRRKRGRTGRGGGRQPFVGPMDHSYRATNEING